MMTQPRVVRAAVATGVHGIGRPHGAPTFLWGRGAATRILLIDGEGAA